MNFETDLVLLGIVVGLIGLAIVGTMAFNYLGELFKKRGRKGFLYWFLLISSYVLVLLVIMYFVTGRNLETTIAFLFSEYCFYIAGPLAAFWTIICYTTRNIHIRWSH